jgi:hypothetical protein
MESGPDVWRVVGTLPKKTDEDKFLRLEAAQANLSQILKRRIIKLRLAGWIVGVAMRDDDDHSLTRTS